VVNKFSCIPEVPMALFGANWQGYIRVRFRSQALRRKPYKETADEKEI
jgi:hypothetical protein